MLNKVALPITLENEAVSITLTTNFGPAQLNQSYGAKAISTLMKAEIPSAAAVCGEESIPDSSSHLTFARKNIININRLQDAAAEISFDNWLGCLAVVLLSHLRGYKLEVEELKGSDNAINSKYFDRNGTYHILTKDGKPIAVFDREVLLVPFRSIPESVMKNVEWFRGEDAIRRIPCGFQPLNAGNFLTDYERRVLVSALDALVNDSSIPVNVKNALYKAMQTVGAAPLPKCSYKQTEIGKVLPYRFASRLFQLPCMAVQPPAKPFSDKLVLLPGTRLGDGLAGADCPLMALSISGKKEIYGALYPLSEEMCTFLTKNKDVVKVKCASFDGSAFDRKGEISFKLELEIAGADYSRTVTFRGKDQLLMADSFFDCTLYPNIVTADSEGNNTWDRYLFTQYPLDGDIYGNLRQTYTGISEKVSAVSADKLMVQGGIVIQTSYKDGKESCAVNHISFGQFPEFISFQIGDDKAGCLHIQPPAAVPLNPTVTGIYAVDLGTSNSLVQASISNRPDNNLSVELFRKEDLRELSRFRLGLGQQEESVSAIDRAHFRFLNYYWLGGQVVGASLPTVVQLAESKNTNAPVCGHMVLSGDAIQHYLFLSSLPENRIYNNIKLTDGAKQPAEVFLRHLMEQCMLHAARNGAGNMKFKFTYPDKQVYSAFQQVWQSAVSGLAERKVLNVTQTFDALPENLSAAAYVLNRALPPSSEIGFAVIDIGGGTSDISLFRKMKPDTQEAPQRPAGPFSVQQRQSVDPTKPSLLTACSIRLAGNDLVARSLYRTAIQYEFTEFSSLFRFAESEKTVLNDFYSSLREVSVPENGSKADAAEFEARKSAIVNTILSRFPFNNLDWDNLPAGTACEFFRTLLRARIVGLLFLLSEHIRGANGADFQADPYGQYTLQFCGGGSKCLSLLGDRFLRTCLPAMFCYLFEAQDARFHIATPVSTDKVEVAQGALLMETKAGFPVREQLTALGADAPAGQFSEAAQEAYSRLTDLFRSDADGLFALDGKPLAESLTMEVQPLISQVSGEVLASGGIAKECVPAAVAALVLNRILDR